ncbi:site-2 protease family protein, partial [Neisseria sp. P0014.S008]|uniref:site-2 protease family protein n=1 Tax=Neisseria sp. P0014.S008 TaxID=3436754 RepID=UPI003F821C85
MKTIIAFNVAILILVSLQEFAHYIVARWCGVKVLRFSVGFGKPFFTRKRGETEWWLAPIPLGGYVKM